MCPFVESTSNGTKCTLKMSLLKKGLLQCAAYGIRMTGFAVSAILCHFSTQLKHSVSRRRTSVYITNKRPASAAEQQSRHFYCQKIASKCVWFFFSCAGRHQLCYAYNCVTLMWHIDGEILHLFYSIFSRKKCGIHSCYQLWNNPFRNSNYLPISKKPLLRRWAAVFRINNASFPNRHFNSMHFMG